MAIKKKNNSNLKKKKSQIEYEELTGDINSWDWSESAGTSDAFLTDDVGGFLCLEEISDVEIEYEGDETTGKVAKFKVREKKINKENGLFIIFLENQKNRS